MDLAGGRLLLGLGDRAGGGLSVISLAGAPELRPRIARALVQNGIDLLRIDRGAARLESIFLKLTKDGAAGAPSGGPQ